MAPTVVTGGASMALNFNVRTAGVVIPGHLLAYVGVVAQPHYHPTAKKDDLIVAGSEIGLVLVVLFVGFKLVACRLHPT